MPEKPEVLTVVKSLITKILNKKIIECEVYWNNIIVKPNINEFKNKIKNQSIIDITTRGKWIVIHLDNYVLLIHLRMEGKFFFRDKNEDINKHEHVVFTFNDNTQMRFHDVRKFGKMYLLNKDNYLKEEPLNKMGYEFDDKDLKALFNFSLSSGNKNPIRMFKVFRVLEIISNSLFIILSWLCISHIGAST